MAPTKRKRKPKFKEPAKLWELHIKEVQELYDSVSKFPQSRMAKIYKAELERSDRTYPQNLEEFYE